MRAVVRTQYGSGGFITKLHGTWKTWTEVKGWNTTMLRYLLTGLLIGIVLVCSCFLGIIIRAPALTSKNAPIWIINSKVTLAIKNSGRG